MGRLTFPKTQRLLKKDEFRAVLDHGEKAVRRELVYFVQPRSEAGPTRLGLIVSKKIGHAVTRNRVKRKLREAFRSAELTGSWDIVVIARAAARGATVEELRGVLRRGYDRARQGAR